MNDDYQLENLEKARRFAKSHPRYHQCLKRHPWLPGLYLIIAGILAMILWIFGPDTSDSSRLARSAYFLMPYAGVSSISIGIYLIIRYILYPQKVHQEFDTWEKRVLEPKRKN